jgi:hypothetical protein
MSTKKMEMDIEDEVEVVIKVEAEDEEILVEEDRGCYYCFNCWKDDHISPDFPIKDITDLKFCNICGVGDHSLEDCLIVLEKL